MSTVVKMDLDKINEGFAPIPAGDYAAYVFEVEPKTFSTGSKGFKITYNIAHPAYQKRKVWDNIVLSEKAMWKLGQFYKAVTGETGEVDIDTSTLPSFVGKQVELSLKVEENTYQGETKEQNVVSDVKYVDGANASQPDLSDSLAERDATVTDDDLPW